MLLVPRGKNWIVLEQHLSKTFYIHWVEFSSFFSSLRVLREENIFGLLWVISNQPSFHQLRDFKNQIWSFGPQPVPFLLHYIRFRKFCFLGKQSMHVFLTSSLHQFRNIFPWAQLMLLVPGVSWVALKQHPSFTYIYIYTYIL